MLCTARDTKILLHFIVVHMDPVHTPETCIIQINFNIIFPSTLRSLKLYLPFTYSDKNFASISQLSNVSYIPSYNYSNSFFN